jgi:monofunctional biosynthetic peptidoglycan transglycosylase
LTRVRTAPKSKRKRKSFLKTAALICLALFVLFYAGISCSLLLLRWIDPAFTAVQAERRISSWFQSEPYTKYYEFIPLDRVSVQLQHAVIAAEDERFFQHHGFDWKEIERAAQEDIEDHRERGASTITQQLVRNLFLSTNRSIIRKGLEFSIVPLTEAILSKRRILELYLNVIEFGHGIFGAEAASRIYFHVPAQRLTRLQAAELASVLPSPLHRIPGRVGAYTKRILARMAQMAW